VRRIIALCAIAIALSACSGDGDSSGNGDGGGSSEDLARYESDLRDAVPVVFKELIAGEPSDAYGYLAGDFKEKCSLTEWTGVFGLLRIFTGTIDADDVDVRITGIRYERDRAFVDTDISVSDEPYFDDEDSEFEQYWIREDGEWRMMTDDPEPCDGGFAPSPDATPASGPGSSRGEAAPLGDNVRAGDLEIRVLNVDDDADLSAISEFETTPVAGKRAVLVRIEATHAGGGGDESINVSESDFKLTGSNNVLYDTFEDGCGFIEDDLDGEMFPGGRVEGYVCFQAPDTEDGLILVYTPGFGFDDDARRFFRLE
jgi:hypothetical protein